MKLKTENPRPSMGQRALASFYETELAKEAHSYNADYEHGQWWITDLDTGRQWSVVDAVGGRSVDGFDFEQVSDGDEEL